VESRYITYCWPVILAPKSFDGLARWLEKLVVGELSTYQEYFFSSQATTVKDCKLDIVDIVGHS
jgi:hypothetical protein